ncbi:hypothetical protein [Sinimarinibacterium sp. NLF-5-8]|uniref:hypothetical protein n=1 Tax=Sinimarinibacterium sp. NLF-5-8 TaxID=2698684 RepID=UPI00137B9B11|nr:hypothetical protein [Sinimarinibacterium sp. NLF-5-8]QHS09012.1 hypothetical protein GT972_01875 [Sinimarinibacterium sp. NLF-5-8]
MGMDQFFYAVTDDRAVQDSPDDPNASCLDVHADGVKEIVQLRNHYELHVLIRLDISYDWEGFEYLEIYAEDVPLIATLGASVATLCRALKQCFDDGKRVFYHWH